VLHQVKGREKYLPLGGGDVEGEPRPRGDAGKVGQARLQGGAEHEELVLPAEGEARAAQRVKIHRVRQKKRFASRKQN
jgi:hypothetical protein